MKSQCNGSSSRTWRSRLRCLALAVGTLLALTNAACRSTTNRGAFSEAGAGGYWKCGESSGNLNDSSGNGNTATANGTITYGVVGPIVDHVTTAISIAGGSGNHFSVASAASLPSGDVLSYSVRFKMGSLAVASYGFGGQTGISTGSPGMRCFAVGNGTSVTLYLEAWDGTTEFILANSSTTISDTTTWHFVTFTKNGSTSKIYLDGNDVTVAGGNITLAPSDAGFAIGGGPGLSDFNGSLSQIALYKTALTLQ